MNKKVSCLFLFGFFTGIIIATNQKDRFLPQERILSYETDNTVSPTATPTPQPANIPTPTPKITSTPKPTPTQTPDATPTPEIHAPVDLEPLFDEFANVYQVDKNKLKSIAKCESNFARGVLTDPYAGMYQFTESTWIYYRNLMEKDADINLRFGARESIETAAYVMSIGKSHIWPSCQ